MTFLICRTLVGKTAGHTLTFMGGSLTVTGGLLTAMTGGAAAPLLGNSNQSI